MSSNSLGEDLARFVASKKKDHCSGEIWTGLASLVSAGTAIRDVDAVREEVVLGRPVESVLAERNDRLRSTFEGGRVFVTKRVWALGLDMADQVLIAVKTFRDFNPENDPRGQHDFGGFEIEDKKFVWKISDCNIDHSCEYSGYPAKSLTLTIMLASEY